MVRNVFSLMVSVLFLKEFRNSLVVVVKGIYWISVRSKGGILLIVDLLFKSLEYTLPFMIHGRSTFCCRVHILMHVSVSSPSREIHGAFRVTVTSSCCSGHTSYCMSLCWGQMCPDSLDVMTQMSADIHEGSLEQNPFC